MEKTWPISQSVFQARLLRLWNDPALRLGIVLFLIARILTAVIAFGVVKSVEIHAWYDLPNRPVYHIHNAVFVTQGPLRPWLEPWYRWDTGWYLFVAYNGYNAENGTIVFTPLYPAMIRALAHLTGGDYLAASLLISSLFCITALVLFYRLVALEYGEHTAHLSTIFLMSFPTAFYLLAGYTESLYLTTCLAALLAARRRHYLLSGVAGVLASLTRQQGWILFFPLAYMLFVETGDFRQVGKQPVELAGRLFAVGASPAMTAIYLFGMQLGGMGSASQALSSHWHVVVTPPWITIYRAALVVVRGAMKPIDFLNIPTFLFMIAVGAATFRRLKIPDHLYLWVTFGFILTRYYAPFQFQSLPRYAVSIFPLFIAWALLLDRPTRAGRAARIGYIVVGCLIQAVLVALYVQWQWVA